MIQVTVKKYCDYICELRLEGHTQTDICSAVTGMCEMVRVNLEFTGHYQISVEFGNALFQAINPTLKGDMLLRCLERALLQIAEENPNCLSVNTSEVKNKG